MSLAILVDIVRNFPLYVALAAVLLASGCASTPPTAPEKPTSKLAGALTTPEAQAEYHIMVGAMAADLGQSRQAATQYLAATQAVPNPHLSATALMQAFSAKDDALALQAAQALAQQKPDDRAVQSELLGAAVRNNKMDVAMGAAKKLLALDADTDHRESGFRLLADVLSQSALMAHAKTATAVMAHLVALHENDPAAHYAAGLLALRHHNAPVAARQAQRAQQLAPGSFDTTMLLAAAQIGQGKLAAADHTVAPLLTRRSAREVAQLRLGYAQILIKFGRHTHARERLQVLLKHRPHDNAALLLLARTDLALNRLQEADQMLARIPVGNQKRDRQVQYLLGRIAEEQRDYPAALNHYKKAAKGGLRLTAGLRQALVLGKLNRGQESRVVLAVLLSIYPQHAAKIIATQSQILLEHGDAKDALKIIDQALSKVPDNNDLLYQRALLYDRLDRAPEAERDLRKLLQAHPYRLRYLNALGFLLAEHGAPTALDEARQLIGKALARAPEDPAVLDSMGWVLFRQGDTHQSLTYLHHAYALMKDPDIAAHLVRALAASGNQTAARQTLNSALKHNPDNAALKSARNDIDHPPAP